MSLWDPAVYVIEHTLQASRKELEKVGFHVSGDFVRKKKRLVASLNVLRSCHVAVGQKQVRTTNG